MRQRLQPLVPGVVMCMATLIIGGVVGAAQLGAGAVLSSPAGVGMAAFVGLLAIEVELVARGFAKPNASDFDL